MSILGENAPLIIFGAVQLLSLVGTIYAVKTDAKILGIRVDGLQDEMKKLGSVLINMVEQKGEINLIQERLMLQGKRFDLLVARFDRFIDDKLEKL